MASKNRSGLGGSSGSGSDDERPWYTILEPHASLRYVGRLFKALAIGLFLLLIAELGFGIAQDGFDALPLLLLEVAQLVLFTGLMWGAGDLAYIVIETNHDVRASRVLLWQLNMLQRMELGQKGMSVEPIDPSQPIPSE
jgi:hypothetical protein